MYLKNMFAIYISFWTMLHLSCTWFRLIGCSGFGSSMHWNNSLSSHKKIILVSKRWEQQVIYLSDHQQSELHPKYRVLEEAEHHTAKLRNSLPAREHHGSLVHSQELATGTHSLRQMDPFRILPHYHFFMIHFNIIPRLCFYLIKMYLPFGFSY